MTKEEALLRAETMKEKVENDEVAIPSTYVYTQNHSFTDSMKVSELHERFQMLVDEDKDYYYIRYASTNNNIMIHHIPYFNDGPLFEINSMAQRSMALIETVEAMFSGQNISSFLFDSPEKMVSAFFKSIAMHTDINDMDAFVSDNKEKVSNGAILFIDPNQSNQRLVMQQGLFMFPYTLDEKKHLQVIESNTSLIKIKKDLRDELLAYLDTIGINAFRIMPDLPSVCEAVERKVKDRRSANRTLFKKK